MTAGQARFPLWLFAGLLALAVLSLAGLAIGPFPVSARDAVRALWAAATGTESGLATSAEAVILQVRAPRVFGAIVVGAALAAAGAAFQSLFKNPLASPDILGVTAGCALGAVIAIVLALPTLAVQGLAFAGGIAAVAAVVSVASWVGKRDPLLTLILTGVVVGSLFGAGVALAKTIADPQNQLPAITFWLLGSFTGVAPAELAIALVLVAGGTVPLVLLRWRIDLLALPDDEARSLGVNVNALRYAVIASATLATASAVSLAGVIGWVGLVIPHAARLLVGASFRRVLPLSLVLGAAFMITVDTTCRVVAATEIPPGVVTALVGAPAFIALLVTTLRR